MKDHLTKAEEILMYTVRNEWIDRAYNPPKKSKKKIQKAIEDLYVLCSLNKPEVIIVESPLASQIVANNVRDDVGANVRDNVRDDVGANVRDNVGANVWDSVWDNVNVWDNVRDKKLAYFDFSYYGNYGDYGWTAFYDFFAKINVVNDKKFNKWKEILQSGIYELILFEKLAIVAVQPQPIKWVELRGRRVMHSEIEPAIKWKDGFEIYFLWGVRFDKELWEKVVGKKMTFKEIAKLGNIEQRMVAFKLKPEVLAEAGKLIHSSERGNKLYEVKDIFSQTEYFIEYECPSTGRQYFKCVDPEVGKKGNADECQAWSFKLKVEEYNQLKIEA